MALANSVLRNVQIEGIEPALRVVGTVSSGGIPEQLEVTQDLSVGDLDYTTSISNNFLVNGIYFNFSNIVTQTISLEYNGIEIFKTDVDGTTNVFINMEKFKILGNLGKQLTVKCTNTSTPSVVLEVTLDVEVI
jgi:hypothetical protein